MIVGIDAGKRGAIACLDPNTMSVKAEIMPYVGTELDVRRVIEILKDYNPRFVILERQIPMAGQGRVSIFSIAKAYGELRACVESLNVSYQTPLPSQWTKVALAGVPGKGKERNVAACRRLFPNLDMTPGRVRKPHDGIADAALLAWYGARLTGCRQ